jgi:hypothetical protein
VAWEAAASEAEAWGAAECSAYPASPSVRLALSAFLVLEH